MRRSRRIRRQAIHVHTAPIPASVAEPIMARYHAASRRLIAAASLVVPGFCALCVAAAGLTGGLDGASLCAAGAAAIGIARIGRLGRNGPEAPGGWDHMDVYHWSHPAGLAAAVAWISLATGLAWAPLYGLAAVLTLALGTLSGSRRSIRLGGLWFAIPPAVLAVAPGVLAVVAPSAVLPALLQPGALGLVLIPVVVAAGLSFALMAERLDRRRCAHLIGSIEQWQLKLAAARARIIRG